MFEWGVDEQGRTIAAEEKHSIAGQQQNIRRVIDGLTPLISFACLADNKEDLKQWDILLKQVKKARLNHSQRERGNSVVFNICRPGRIGENVDLFSLRKAINEYDNYLARGFPLLRYILFVSKVKPFRPVSVRLALTRSSKTT